MLSALNSLRCAFVCKEATTSICFSRKLHAGAPSFLKWYDRTQHIKKDGPKEPVKDMTREELDALARGDEIVKLQDKWAHLTEEQLLKKRDKSRLPNQVRKAMKGEPEFFQFTRFEHYRKDYVKSHYAKYGKASGLKPGVCWGSLQEVQFKVQWEETFQPSLEKLMDDDRREKEEKAAHIQKNRDEIMANLKQLPKALEEFQKKLDMKKKDEVSEMLKKEKLVQDVREYLGYDVSPHDVRFQEALQKKEEEERVVAKASKKQEKQARIMAQLSAMAEEEVKKALNVKGDAEKNVAEGTKSDGKSN